MCVRAAPLQRRQASFRPFQSPLFGKTSAKRASRVLAAAASSKASAKELAAKFGGVSRAQDPNFISHYLAIPDSGGEVEFPASLLREGVWRGWGW